MNRGLDFDFAVRRRPAPRFGLALLAAGTLLAGFGATRVSDVLAARASSRDGLAQVEAAAQPPTARPATRPPADPRASARTQAGRQVAQALQTPWADLLEAVEARPRADVALLAIEPSALKRTVRITAEARDANAMLDHLTMLQKDARLSDVTLVSHQRQAQAPGAPWRYQIQGSW